MKTQHCLVGLGALLLAGCSQPLAKAKTRSGGGIIVAINHTKWAINHFSVNGQSGIDSIGPYQGGGGGCCYGVPPKWRPGMKVKIDWEAGVGGSKGFPGFEDREKFLKWKKEVQAQHKQHSTVVEVPDYTGQKTCGITVHFMPCDEVKVSTSCVSPGRPGYPINEPLEMPEPQYCPK
ncbi:DUF3304 domain-containing protein [Pantoea eucrina]|uniref:DUF3304 domain-containing protein n=1 Tax=Pantoea eucrina TaxID=472693 RepID=A0ABU5LJD6_9GAMM|nr:DUF3304 domain-containing protein [Pantoea eucrina]MDZ7280042.1 DUF3304 domain-containing protein [Pantoea eucrina]